jgi:tripartite-type tricarboxylate transporter receptor subunit TctC
MPAAAISETWPSRPVTFVVSNGAGSSPDVMARLLADKLSPLLGQAVIVENRVGAANVIGAMNVVRAAPDGYRFYFSTSPALSSNIFLVKNLPYDPLKDFEPVATIVQSAQLVVVNKSLAVDSLQALIALEHKNPGSMNIATDGPRNISGIIASALNQRAGTHFVPVAYPNIVNGLQETISGRVPVGVFPTAIASPMMAEGTIRALGVSANRRLSNYPDIPPISDLFPGFNFGGWFMLAAPHGTPPDIVNKLNAAVDKAMHDKAVVEMIPKLGYQLNPAGIGSPDDAKAFLTTQIEFWHTTVEKLGLKPE